MHIHMYNMHIKHMYVTEFGKPSMYIHIKLNSISLLIIIAMLKNCPDKVTELL